MQVMKSLFKLFDTMDESYIGNLAQTRKEELIAALIQVEDPDDTLAQELLRKWINETAEVIIDLRGTRDKEAGEEEDLEEREKIFRYWNNRITDQTKVSEAMQELKMAIWYVA